MPGPAQKQMDTRPKKPWPPSNGEFAERKPNPAFEKACRPGPPVPLDFMRPPLLERTRPAPFMRENPNVNPNRESSAGPGDLFRVVIIDNDYNTYQEVIEICMEALGTDLEHAYKIALAVDHNGEADVVRAPREEAERVAEVIRSIGIEVRVLPADET